MFRTIVMLTALAAPGLLRALPLGDAELAACAERGVLERRDIELLSAAAAPHAEYRTRHARALAACRAAIDAVDAASARERKVVRLTPREQRMLAGTRAAFAEYRTSRLRLAASAAAVARVQGDED